MLRPRVMPCLLLQDGALVKTIKFKNPRYVGDPINAIRIYNEKEVDELIVLDITASVERREPPYKLLEEIASECFMPVTYGGGISTIDQIQQLLSLGVEKVAINTAAINDPEFIRRAGEKFGSSTIVGAMDVKKAIFGGYRVYTQSGKKKTALEPVAWAKTLAQLGVGELMLYSIDRDGTRTGYDLELIKQVTGAVTVSVIACGGAGTVEDFRLAIDHGAAAVAAGSMVVFYGPHQAVLISFPEPAELDRIFS